MKPGAGRFLQIDCGQWQGFEFSSRFLNHFSNFSNLGVDTPFEKNDNDSTVEEMIPPPIKDNIDVLLLVCDLDAPKRLWYKVFDSEVSINNKSKGWKLT